MFVRHMLAIVEQKHSEHRDEQNDLVHRIQDEGIENDNHEVTIKLQNRPSYERTLCAEHLLFHEARH